MSIKGVMTTRDLNRQGGVTGAARVQQEREKEKYLTDMQIELEREQRIEEEKREESKRIKLLVREALKEEKLKTSKKAKKKKVKNGE